MEECALFNPFSSVEHCKGMPLALDFHTDHIEMTIQLMDDQELLAESPTSHRGLTVN